MADTTIIAVAGIAATGITGIVGPWLSGKLESAREDRRFRHERLLSDFDEIRSLLDECAEALNAYIDAVNGTEAFYAFSQSQNWSDYEPRIDGVIAAKQQAYGLNRRIVIRLGRDHSVVKAYGVVLALLDQATARVGTLVSERASARSHSVYPEAVETSLEFVATQELRQNERYAANEAFLDAATALVGSPVEPLKKD